MLRNLLIAVLFINQMADAQNVNTTSSYFNDVLTDWTSANFGELEISKEFTDKHNGVTHIYGVQSYKGLAIHPAFFDVQLRAGSRDFLDDGFLSRALAWVRDGGTGESWCVSGLRVADDQSIRRTDRQEGARVQ